ncbi:MAG: nicotinamide-nucleotide amidohydrolase family protein [Spirochaetia bacterium]|nr:nicotinamide-nucleotide amidohydrolase family protein [Spirochaetia bacterium]
MPHLHESIQSQGVRLLIIGSEVTQGFIFDTNTQFICAAMFEIGVEVKEIRVIPDDKETIIKTLNEFLSKDDFILTTGGLGPTDDDLTVDILCEIMNVKAVFIKDCEKRVKIVIEKYAREAPSTRSRYEKRLYRQCRIPENAQALPNHAGLAPGIFISDYKIVSLPGFPLEIRNIWPHALEKIRQNVKSHFLSKTFNIWGVMESILYESLQFSKDSPNKIIMGNHSLAWGNQLFLRTSEENKVEYDALIQQIHEKFGANIVENPILAWIDHLKKNKLTFGAVESCTGGYASKLLTDIPGVSDIFPGGIISYDNQIKEDVVGVSGKTLEKFGAVSRETALEMALGGAKKLGSDITISITGIAGPTGGSEEKPVGTVYFGIYNKKEKSACTGHGYFPFGRERFRNAVVHFIYLMLYQRYVYYNDESLWLKTVQGQSFQPASLPESLV